MTLDKKLRISIDRGGTFTDCIATRPDGDDIVVKILSVDPNNYSDAPSEAIRQVLETYRDQEVPRGTKLDLYDVGKSQLRLIFFNPYNALLTS